MSVIRKAGPISTAEQVVALLLDRADHEDIVSVKATMKEARDAAPYLLESDEEPTEVVVTVATVRGLFVAFDSRE
ncbi:hypothetical protein GCM10010869_34610 [Mesorhizobium tianshanense]|uniref:Uncharacterized protein n=1 Tax=Mesorhizobium tianshanense TaxID=39844 RepID=A0A562NFQ5_9HYPH|nr:hypothetical protein [Mesorhizobium tianshanense]TWI30923.1 hypothetical protein IQ26_04750 [Mesorhizobium tianshanense]GLS37867.1 hypothetical protein GCM10010869_34610 [Mesorhizobium tianshanense]